MTNHPFAPSVQMHHATRAKAWKLSMTLQAEYPRLSLVAVEGDEVDHEDYENALAGFKVLVDEDEDQAILETEKVPELADILDACAEQEIDPTVEEEEEPKLSGSVVPETYRRTYREVSSNGQTCGDWLAERLVADTTDAKGNLNVHDLTEIFRINGVDMTAKWAQLPTSGQRGWQGRYRMSGRIVLEKIIAKRGTYIEANGAICHPDADWLEAMRSKHAKWLAKEAKREAAAEAAIKEAVEGA